MQDQPDITDLREQVENGENDSEHPILDPFLVKFLQQTPGEDMLVELDGSSGNKATDKIGLLKNFVSDKDDFRAKSNITPEQVYALVMLRNLDSFTPEESNINDFLIDLIDDFERYALSLDGMGYQTEANVFRAVFGDTSELEPAERDSMLMNLISNPPAEKQE